MSSSLCVGTTLMMGNVYIPSMVGEVIRVTPTQYVVRLDDGNECRVRKDTMRVVGGDIRAFRVVAAEDVVQGREQYRRDRAMMDELGKSLTALAVSVKAFWNQRLVWMTLQDIEDAIRRRSTVDIKMATAQINDCVATLRKLNGEWV